MEKQHGKKKDFRLYLAGGFPNLKLPQLENRMLDLVYSKFGEYNRLVSHWFPAETKTAIDLKRYDPKWKPVSLFYDSGAHSLFNQIPRDLSKHKKITKEELKTMNYDYYDSEPFWEYVDGYVKKVKENKDLFDVYVTIDAIMNPKRTYEIQQHLEKQGIHPLPVVHFGTDSKWLYKYMDNHEYIGLGGLGSGVNVVEYYNWADKVFDILKNGKEFPQWKTHGFAVTSSSLMLRYPWASVDSSTWNKFGYYGHVAYPKKKGGEWDFSKTKTITVSNTAPSLKYGVHYQTMSYSDQKDSLLLADLNEWMEMHGFVMGKSEFKRVQATRRRVRTEVPQAGAEYWAEKKVEGQKTRLMEIVIEPGLSNDYRVRDQFNVMFFIQLQKYVNTHRTLTKKTLNPLF